MAASTLLVMATGLWLGGALSAWMWSGRRPDVPLGAAALLLIRT